jgi:hypothetical protein
MAPGEQSAGFPKRLLARQIDESLQRYIDFGQQLVQQAGVREQCPRRIRVRPDGWRLRSEPVDALLERLDGIR